MIWTIPKASYVNEHYKLRPETKAYIDKYGVPTNLWHRYRERFTMRPQITSAQNKPVEPTKLMFIYYNGEQEDFSPEQIKENAYVLRARPKSIAVNWNGTWQGKVQPFQVLIEFDEAEIMKAYAAVYENDRQGRAEIIVKLGSENNQYKVFLKGNSQDIELLKLSGQVYRSP